MPAMTPPTFVPESGEEGLVITFFTPLIIMCLDATKKLHVVVLSDCMHELYGLCMHIEMMATFCEEDVSFNLKQTKNLILRELIF